MPFLHALLEAIAVAVALDDTCTARKCRCVALMRGPIEQRPRQLRIAEYFRPAWKFQIRREDDGAVQIPFPERRIAVDAGAIPYVVNGADIMRPGIVSVTDDVKADKPVQIVDERHGKPLAIGIALFDAPGIRASTTGKMVKKFHHVGDEIWNLEI